MRDQFWSRVSGSLTLTAGKDQPQVHNNPPHSQTDRVRNRGKDSEPFGDRTGLAHCQTNTTPYQNHTQNQQYLWNHYLFPLPGCQSLETCRVTNTDRLWPRVSAQGKNPSPIFSARHCNPEWYDVTYMIGLSFVDSTSSTTNTQNRNTAKIKPSTFMDFPFCK